jgi:hypothetical protein
MREKIFARVGVLLYGRKGGGTATEKDVRVPGADASFQPAIDVLGVIGMPRDTISEGRGRNRCALAAHPDRKRRGWIHRIAGAGGGIIGAPKGRRAGKGVRHGPRGAMPHGCTRSWIGSALSER